MSSLSASEPIAIIGMAGRFPGARDVEEHWTNLVDGVTSIRIASDDELVAAGVSRATLTDPHYVKATAIAPDVDAFDAEFFGLTPREARISDPQIRLFLECAHAAIENAGYDVDALGAVGVFGAATPNRYIDLVARAERIDLRAGSGLAATTLNAADYLAPLVSYKLGVHGPSIAVLAACSSSLVAVHLATASLAAGECDLALAGAVEVELPLGHGYLWEPGGTLSRDGRCRPFDRRAGGTVRATGAGVVALKRLADAIADGDHIRAVIRATAVNNDGAAKVGFAAPSVAGQTAVAVEAMALAGITARDLDLVEAHGTGTALGDSIEVAALTAALERMGGMDPRRCVLTSVKGNIGHLGHASGIASLIKVALALENETIPANVGFDEPNSALEPDGSPFRVPTSAVAWPRQESRARVAGINTFGVGGTNAHAIVQEAPVREATPLPRRPRIVVWSARTPTAASRYRDRLAEHFQGPGRRSFAPSVLTLQNGRKAFRYRGAVVAADAHEAVAALRDPGSAAHFTTSAPGCDTRVAFLLPGWGTPYADMAAAVYESVPAYARAFDECVDLFEAQGIPLRRLWNDRDESRLARPTAAQPLLTGIEYALTQMWRAWGITPDAVLGLGVGELVAGLVAGVLTLEETVKAVTVRARAIEDLPAGGMLAVGGSPAQVRPLLTGGAVIAAVNGPNQVLVAGQADELDAVAERLGRVGLSVRHMGITRASYAPSAAPARPIFDKAMREVRLRPPTLDFYSAATGRLVTAEEATDPSFWSRQLVEPLVFADALDALASRDERFVMIEVGPGRALTAVGRQHPAVVDGRHQMLPTLARRRSDRLADLRSALSAVAAVWTEGQSVDWAAVEDVAALTRVPVPGYPYERTRYWVDAPPDTGATTDDPSPFALPTWVERPRDRPPADLTDELALALLPGDRHQAAAVTASLCDAGLRVVGVRHGDAYVDEGDAFTIRPGQPEDLGRVFRSLERRELSVNMLVHAATADTVSSEDTAGHGGDLRVDEVYDQISRGFLAGVDLLRQASRGTAGCRPDLLVLTRGSVDVSGHDPVHPGYAALTTLVRAQRDEHGLATAKLIDIGDGVAEAEVAAEIGDRDGEQVVALRGDRRWIPVERPLEVCPSSAPVVAPGGVCLIVGGTGKLWGVVAGLLAKTGTRPVLVFAGRTGTMHAQVLAELNCLDAVVDVVGCDVGDPVALTALVDDVTRRHGHITAVFHLARSTGEGGSMHTSTGEAVAAFGSKIADTLTLASIFADRLPLELFVAFSGPTTLDETDKFDKFDRFDEFGGEVADAAADAAVDTLIRAGRLAARRVLIINWPRRHIFGQESSAESGHGLTAAEGGALMMELLRATTPRQVAVRGSADGRPPAHQAMRRQMSPARSDASAGSEVGAAGQPAVAAGTLERLRALWTAQLGRAQIAPDADFFDLGGNSLSAVELMSRVRAEFAVDLGVVTLFDHSTLGALAEQIDRER